MVCRSTVGSCIHSTQLLKDESMPAQTMPSVPAGLRAWIGLVADIENAGV